uniref:Uncharacterized protein n=1 Tax=Anguilla anguilla TaxID=7936 RepID=A0A0E9Y1R0_ANGAN
MHSSHFALEHSLHISSYSHLLQQLKWGVIRWLLTWGFSDNSHWIKGSFN